MWRKKIIFILFPIFSCTCLLAQQDTSFYRIALKFTPTALLNPNTATALAGIEVRFHQKWSVQTEYGFQLEKFALADWNYEKDDWHYYKIKGDLKYWIPILKNTEMYLSAGYFSVHQKYRKWNDFLTLNNREIYQYEYSQTFVEKPPVLLHLSAFSGQ